MPSARQNGPVEIAEQIAELRDQGARLADAAERAGLQAAVPPCPPWLVKDLLRHTGHIHRWDGVVPGAVTGNDQGPIINLSHTSFALNFAGHPAQLVIHSENTATGQFTGIFTDPNDL